LTFTAQSSKIKEKTRQFVLDRGEKCFRNLESIIGRFSQIGDRTFFDNKTYSWVEELEANWQTIRQELDRLLSRLEYLQNFQDISPDQYNITRDDKWKTYLFYAYGLKAEKNCKHCPETTRAIEAIPGMKTAFFSILLPHKQIPEHRGPYKGVVRYHLGLKVPSDWRSCGIRVGKDIRHWQEGKSLLFDDTFPHAAPIAFRTHTPDPHPIAITFVPNRLLGDVGGGPRRCIWDSYIVGLFSNESPKCFAPTGCDC